MVLKDIQCVRCGAVREAYCEMDETVVHAHCESCGDGKPRQHTTLCTGGIKRRWRYNDPPMDPTGYIQSAGVACGRPHLEAVDTPDESRCYEPDRLYADGSITHEHERFSESAIADRRKERREQQRTAQGRGRLFFGA